jgi:putative transcriptional regulator
MPKKVNEHDFYCERLNNLRKKSRLSQSKLAFLLNVSRNTISSIETGKYQPSLALFMRIMDVFHIYDARVFFQVYAFDEGDSNA